MTVGLVSFDSCAMRLSGIEFFMSSSIAYGIRYFFFFFNVFRED